MFKPLQLLTTLRRSLGRALRAWSQRLLAEPAPPGRYGADAADDDGPPAHWVELVRDHGQALADEGGQDRDGAGSARGQRGMPIHFRAGMPAPRPSPAQVANAPTRGAVTGRARSPADGDADRGSPDADTTRAWPVEGPVPNPAAAAAADGQSPASGAAVRTTREEQADQRPGAVTPGQAAARGPQAAAPAPAAASRPAGRDAGGEDAARSDAGPLPPSARDRNGSRDLGRPGPRRAATGSAAHADDDTGRAAAGPRADGGAPPAAAGDRAAQRPASRAAPAPAATGEPSSPDRSTQTPPTGRGPQPARLGPGSASLAAPVPTADTSQPGRPSLLGRLARLASRLGAARRTSRQTATAQTPRSERPAATGATLPGRAPPAARPGSAAVTDIAGMRAPPSADPFGPEAAAGPAAASSPRWPRLADDEPDVGRQWPSLPGDSLRPTDGDASPGRALPVARAARSAARRERLEREQRGGIWNA